jgi:hypothetical protein
MISPPGTVRAIAADIINHTLYLEKSFYLQVTDLEKTFSFSRGLPVTRRSQVWSIRHAPCASRTNTLTKQTPPAKTTQSTNFKLERSHNISTAKFIVDSSSFISPLKFQSLLSHHHHHEVFGCCCLAGTYQWSMLSCFRQDQRGYGI